MTLTRINSEIVNIQFTGMLSWLPEDLKIETCKYLHHVFYLVILEELKIMTTPIRWILNNTVRNTTVGISFMSNNDGVKVPRWDYLFRREIEFLIEQKHYIRNMFVAKRLARVSMNLVTISAVAMYETVVLI
jgi:hypothetical protein